MHFTLLNTVAHNAATLPGATVGWHPCASTAFARLLNRLHTQPAPTVTVTTPAAHDAARPDRRRQTKNVPGMFGAGRFRCRSSPPGAAPVGSAPAASHRWCLPSTAAAAAALHQTAHTHTRTVTRARSTSQHINVTPAYATRPRADTRTTTPYVAHTRSYVASFPVQELHTRHPNCTHCAPPQPFPVRNNDTAAATLLK